MEVPIFRFLKELVKRGIDELHIRCFGPEDRMIIDEIIDECSKRSASALVQITHNQAPWKNHYAKGNNIIPPSEIKEYFK